jgi:multidrug efflux pump subunit AcrA (membrane-fusion protein)
METICLKCLQKEPAQRYASAAELADDLHRYLAGEQIKARPLGWVEWGGRWLKRNGRAAGLSAVLLLLLAVAIRFWPNPDPPPPPPPEGIRGHLLPMHRRRVFSPTEAKVVRFAVTPGQRIAEGQTLVVLADSRLSSQLIDLETTISAADEKILLLKDQERRLPAERDRLRRQILEEEERRKTAVAQRDALRRNFSVRVDRPGQVALTSPALPLAEGAGVPKPEWTVIDRNFRERFTGRVVTPSDPLLRLAVLSGSWEVVLKIPQGHLGPVLKSLGREKVEPLDVDFWLPGDPNHTYRGKLDGGRMATEAVAERRGDSGSGFVVEASVRLDGPDIPDSARIPRDLLLVDQEVEARINCREQEPEGNATAPLELPPGRRIARTGVIRVHPEAGDTVWAREEALLARLHIRDGQKIHKGELLAEFHSPDLVRQLAQSEAQQAARAERLRALKAQVDQTAEEKSRRDEEVLMVEGKRNTAAAEIETCKARLASLVLRAPRSGTVLSPPSLEQIGRLWQQGQRVCTIADLSRLQVFLPLPPLDYEMLKKALHTATPAPLRTTIRLEGLDGLACEGQVGGNRLPKSPARVIPVELSSRSGGPVAVLPNGPAGRQVPRDEVYLVAVDLKDPGCLILPGLRAQVTIPLPFDR